VSPLRGEKPKNRPLSKLNTGRLALRAMLPVIIDGANFIVAHPTKISDGPVTHLAELIAPHDR